MATRPSDVLTKKTPTPVLQGSADAATSPSKASWSAELERFDDWQRARGLSEKTRRAYGADLSQLAAWACSRDLAPADLGHRDLRQFAPKATLCSSVWVWDRFLVPELKKVIAGGWKPAPYGAFIEMKDGGTDIAGFGPAVPKDKAALITAERDLMRVGNRPEYAVPSMSRIALKR